MYDLIDNIIGHTWVSDISSSEQQIIYQISGVLILLFTTVLIDLIYKFISGIFKGGY